MIIYKTTNKINGKIYIGQSIFDDPMYFGSGTQIRNAINEDGKENFKKDFLHKFSSKEEMKEL